MTEFTVEQTLQIAFQHHQAGRLAQAEQFYRQILSQQPNHAPALHHLGVIAHQVGRDDMAIDLIRRSIALKSNYPQAYSNLGNALQAKGQLDEAIAAYRQAIALKPESPEVHYNLGKALTGTGQLEEAIASYVHAIDLRPGYANAHSNLAALLLTKGDFARGWQEYEWRWKCDEFTSPQRHFAQPMWDGGSLAGATILLHAEQGFGDTMQFIRYLRWVAERGGKIVVECQPELERLLQASGHDCAIIARGQALPNFDFHCPLLSLPLVSKTTVQSIPASIPYLFPPAELLDAWHHKLTTVAAGLKVALAWAGRPTYKSDGTRSITLDRLAPLAGVSGVTFHGIQKGQAARQADNPPAGLQLIDLESQLHDFANTAALIANLDLVISVDTAVAHLAGAMGKPVWVMLPYASDWRWLLDREDSPWYPTMRLFRQPSIGDWDSVVRRVTEALAAIAHPDIGSQGDGLVDRGGDIHAGGN